MAKITPEIKESNVCGDLSAPSWLSRAEKGVFKRVILARKAGGKPVNASEIDAVTDFVSCRTRIAALNAMLAEALPKSSDFAPNQKHAAALIRQIDTTTALSRRLARELKLTANPKEPNDAPE
jgi:hypothetical protein